MLNPGLKELPTLYPIPRIISPYSEIPQISYGDGCQGQLKIVQKWQFENVQLWQFKMAIYG